MGVEDVRIRSPPTGSGWNVDCDPTPRGVVSGSMVDFSFNFVLRKKGNPRSSFVTPPLSHLHPLKSRLSSVTSVDLTPGLWGCGTPVQNEIETKVEFRTAPGFDPFRDQRGKAEGWGWE